jgi:hypothetical protein
LRHSGEGRNPEEQTVLHKPMGIFLLKILFFSYLVKNRKVLTSKNLQPGIWLWIGIPAFAGMTLLNLG